MVDQGHILTRTSQQHRVFDILNRDLSLKQSRGQSLVGLRERVPDVTSGAEETPDLLDVACQRIGFDR